MSENKIEKPENMSESETYKTTPLIEEVNNPKTDEEARFIVRNGDEVVSIDNYLNAKYLYKK